MGIFLLTLAAVIICALINIYDAKQEVKSKERALQLTIRQKLDLEKKIEKLEKDKAFWKEQDNLHFNNWHEEINKCFKYVDSIKEYKETIWDLQQKNRNLENEIKTLKANNNDSNDALLTFTRKRNAELRKEVEQLTEMNNQLMDKIINHLKAKDIITNKTTKAETPKIKANEIIKPVNNSTNWQIINKHGLSVNKMYKENPYYNPFEKDSLPLTKTNEYKVWIKETLRAMEKTNIKSLRSINVNPNKPMKLEVEFKLVRGSDTDNPLKSFIDLLVRYYGLTDDNNFVDIHVTRNPIWANSYSDGKIKFRITNI